MNKLIIQNIIGQEITCKNVKKLMEMVLEDCNLNKLRRVRGYVLSKSYLSNGYTSLFKWKDNYHFAIYINI